MFKKNREKGFIILEKCYQNCEVLHYGEQSPHENRIMLAFIQYLLYIRLVLMLLGVGSEYISIFHYIN